MGSLKAQPTLDHVARMSPIDQVQPRGYIRIILCFPLTSSRSTSSISQHLETTLNATLLHWPLFGGTVSLSNGGGGRLELRYTTPPNHISILVKKLGAPDFPHTYEELNAAGMPLSVLDENLLCSVPPAPQSDSPVPATLVQANFISGALLLSMCLHHAVTDGRGAFLFISAFASACRSNGQGVPPIEITSLDRENVFRPAVEPLKTHLLPYKSVDEVVASRGGTSSAVDQSCFTNCLFKFSWSRLRLLKETLSACLLDRESEWISTNDCLSALLWTTITRARLPNLAPNPISSFAVAVDVRGRTQPPLSPGYAGSAVIHSVTSTTIADLTSPNAACPTYLASLAVSIRKSLISVNDDYVAQVASLSNGFPDVRDFGFRISPMHGPDLMLTSWRDFSYYDLDFGGELGKPGWARKPWSRHAAVIVVLPQDKSDDEKGIEVILLMRDDEIKRLIEDETFMKWVERVVV